MLKHFIYNMTQRNAALGLTVVCFLVCLSVIYTFPLHREMRKWYYPGLYINRTKSCSTPTRHENILERSKKMASNLENALKKFKDSTQDFGKNVYDHLNTEIKNYANKNTISEEDLRQYEQLVIMKKYPYLDLNELELKYSPGKNIRQSIKLETGPYFGNDPSICEPLEDGPNVEIINRGLSGFAIPPQLSKHVGIVDNKMMKLRNLKTVPSETQNIMKWAGKSLEQNFENKLKKYEGRRNKKYT